MPHNTSPTPVLGQFEGYGFCKLQKSIRRETGVSQAAIKLTAEGKKCQGTTGAPGNRGTLWVGVGSRAVSAS